MDTLRKIPYHLSDFVVQLVGKVGRLDNQFSLPLDVLIDDCGNLIVSEMGNQRIHKMTSSGISISSNFIEHLSQPRGITLTSEGKLFVCDSGSGRIEKFNMLDRKFEGGFITGSIPHLRNI